LEVEFLGEFESIFETALDHESENLLGTFGEITLDKKTHATVPLIFFATNYPAIIKIIPFMAAAVLQLSFLLPSLKGQALEMFLCQL
jgi:hypothetical protein